LVNFADGAVVDTSRRFQAASPASYHPALSPTRGSGLGGDIDMSAGTMAPPVEEDDCAHDTTSSEPSASNTFFIADLGGETII
jgi:hypothetical protein